MKHPERVEDYLEHIAEAIENATAYIQELDNVAVLQYDKKTRDAVIRNIEIIGEAANRIQKQAPEFVTAHPELPWKDMRAMRNKVIHDYFDVELTVVWRVVGQFQTDPLPESWRASAFRGQLSLKPRKSGRVLEVPPQSACRVFQCLHQ